MPGGGGGVEAGNKQCTLFDVDLLIDGLAERLINTEKAGGSIYFYSDHLH